MKIDSSYKNARSVLEQLRSERETSDGVGKLKIYQRMSYFVFGVNIFFFFFGGGGVAEN